MSILPWIFLGLIAGYIASKTVRKPGDAIFLDIAFVIAGAVYGGFFFSWMGLAGVTEFHLKKMLVEVVVVFAILVVCQTMLVRRPSAPDRGGRTKQTAGALLRPLPPLA